MIFTYTRWNGKRHRTAIYSDNAKQTLFLMEYHQFFNGRLYFVWTRKWHGWDRFATYRQDKKTLNWVYVPEEELEEIVEKIQPDWETYDKEN